MSRRRRSFNRDFIARNVNQSNVRLENRLLADIVAEQIAALIARFRAANEADKRAPGNGHLLFYLTQQSFGPRQQKFRKPLSVSFEKSKTIFVFFT